MSVEYTYLKNTTVFPDQSDIVGNTIVISNNVLITTDHVPSISVSYNGQLIQDFTSGSSTAFAKYYYTVVNNNAAWLATPITGIESQCSLTITIFANQDFIATGYVNVGAIQVSDFSSMDVFYISYTYSVMKDV